MASPPAEPTFPPHVYIHVPFCTGRCAYCAFYSVPHPELARQWLPGLAAEIDRTLRGGRAKPDTLYIGGGTPTCLRENDFAELLNCVRQRMETEAGCEWTVESNPDTLTPAVCALMRRAGVNRVSIGAQSFDDGVLAAAGRRHGAAAIGDAVAAARGAGFDNVGLDLIAGLPGDTPESWTRSLRRAIDLAPEHVSVYTLSIEEGSRFAQLYAAGALAPVPEEEDLRRLDEAARLLSEAGYDHYETSNYAKPGRACRHNLGYWRGQDYIGFGPAASSRWARRRWTNEPDLAGYQRALAAGCAPPRDEETVSAVTDATERLIFALRLDEGVSLEAGARGDEALRHHWQRKMERLADHGLATCHDRRWRLTAAGRRIADSVAEELIPDR